MILNVCLNWKPVNSLFKYQKITNAQIKDNPDNATEISYWWVCIHLLGKYKNINDINGSNKSPIVISKLKKDCMKSINYNKNN